MKGHTLAPIGLMALCLAVPAAFSGEPPAATPATARWAGRPGKPLELTPKTAAYFIRDNWTDGKPVEFVLDQPRHDPFAMPPVTTLPADQVLAAVLGRAGAFPRDAVTRRTIQEVRDGTGNWGRREPKGGLMEGLTPGAAPLDTDKDGMPDEWEKKNGLDPAKDDASRVMPSGYTVLEVYINELAEQIVCGPTPRTDAPKGTP